MYHLGFDRYGQTNTNTDTDMVIPIQQTDTPLQNLYQTDTDNDICFEIHIKLIQIIGI